MTRFCGALPLHSSSRTHQAITVTLLLFCGLCPDSNGAEIVDHPFLGVTHITRSETSPRSVTMHIVRIDLTIPGISFRLTPPGGTRETVRQTIPEPGDCADRSDLWATGCGYRQPLFDPKQSCPGTRDAAQGKARCHWSACRHSCRQRPANHESEVAASGACHGRARANLVKLSQNLHRALRLLR